jgi:ankyrin repeat protein
MDSNSDNQILLKACLERDIEKICALVELGANPNIKDEVGDSPLNLLANSHGLVFSKLDFVPAIKSLLEAGAKIDQKSRSEGLTPLHQAVESCNENIAIFLIEKGANLNAKDRKGKSILMTGLKRGTEGLVIKLLSKGASVDDISKANKHPISYLPYSSSVELIQTLVEYGADPRADDSHCLVHMIECKNWKASRELVRLGANPNANQDINRTTYAMILSEFGTTEEACQKFKHLASLGADIYLTNHSGQNCLDIATSSNNYLMIECITSIIQESKFLDK